MSDLHSPSWYRVAALRPRLKTHAEVHRHHYRGQLWYVLSDRASRRLYRFNPAAWQVIGLLDGERTVDDAWELACHRLGDDAPTQDETIRLLGQLHGADLLQTEVPPDVDELLRRSQKLNKGKWWRNVRNPMSIKLPLVDPDRLLKATVPLYRWLFTPAGFVLWALLIVAGLAVAAQHWTDLTENVADRILAPGNLLGMIVIFPLVKACHEFGHACAVRSKGGEVHEMGVMLLVFLPVPYVDASASSAFRSKWQRMVVGAAGMMVELALASLAMFVWALVEPGLVRAACFNVMLIAGISTVLFNGNPLLRYDGYYILADALEIPNLAQRAQRYLAYLVERRAFGVREAQAPDASVSEKAWFVFYAIASFVYRTSITFAIVLFIATQYFVIGVLLAIWAGFSSLVLPLAKGLWHLIAGKSLRRHRTRALAVAGSVFTAIAAFAFLAPFPLWTRTEGVLWVPEQAVLRAGAEGFVVGLAQAPGAVVPKGAVLMRLEDPLLAPMEKLEMARLEELRLKLRALEVGDRVQAQIVREEMQYTERELERIRERLAGLTVRSPIDGRFVVSNPGDLPQRFVRKGEQMGFVAPPHERLVRVIVAQDDVDFVRSRTERIEVKLAGRVAHTLPATLLREVPAASGELPSVALSERGGGTVALDPRVSDRAVAMEPLFHFELRLPEGAEGTHIGARAYVRFDHGSEPLATQAFRAARRLFLRRFSL
ncbi:MAG: hypothetical protein MUF30_09675 [Burkholderiales bacterium]|jgi:putative peptide zinc metalloprotease protein|nr:hypothetical protein [Burkholderiales bacterium]